MIRRRQGKSVRGAAAKAKKNRPPDQTRQFEKLLKRPRSSGGKYILRLYVAGTTARSIRAVGNVRALCLEYLAGRYDLRVIDIYQLPEQTIKSGIVAAPTLVKELPRPVRRLIGDFSDRDRLLTGLDLAQAGAGTEKDPPGR